MDAHAHYQLLRVKLDLSKYAEAGYTLSMEPRLCYYTGDSEDHTRCAQREFSDPLSPLPSDSTWSRSWEVTDVRGGIIDLVWDVKPAA